VAVFIRYDVMIGISYHPRPSAGAILRRSRALGRGKGVSLSGGDRGTNRRTLRRLSAGARNEQTYFGANSDIFISDSSS
jgi:hypothetical protein